MTQALIANRYRVVKKLGEGAMGSVFLVEDRLTNTTLALKKVLVSNKSSVTRDNGKYDEYMAIATEFRTLASLRHPNIVSVMDYGFDASGNPFFTMEFLSDYKTMTDAAHGTSFDQQIDYIIQSLQSLAYLHRRGIVHRDIKPANILVGNRRNVKVLDFGLALDAISQTSEEDDNEVVGTVAYVAPEVLQGESASIASDLYAIGIISYEIFSGKHPYNLSSITTLISEILMKQPQRIHEINTAIAELVDTLIAKEPDLRPKDANEVIKIFCESLNRDLPTETSQLRDSFLKASRFVGRRTELSKLTAALQNLQDDEGTNTYWLLSGESGVGKSRILEEVRTHALVMGIRVLRGQAVEAGGLPYHPWRDILRPLLVTLTVSDLEAGILREIIPDIDILLQRDVPEVDSLSGKPSFDRLAVTVVNVLQRFPDRLLLLLEDLQWANESLTLLQFLLQRKAQLAMTVMIVGTYRTDEAIAIPTQLPEMQLLALERFERADVEKLSLSMLGEQGKSDDVIDLLVKETEGNPFFIVEVVRELAETAGRLDRITETDLPERVSAYGVEVILQRRLSRIPRDYRRLLQLAAISGREIDREILAAISTEKDVDDLITAGANTVVFDVIDGTWRFTHDKLRYAVLDNISERQKPELHEVIATTIESVYPNNTGYAEKLANLWDIAGYSVKAIEYIIIASERITNFVADYDRAESLLKRGLELTNQIDNAKQALSQLYVLLGNVEKRRANYTQAEEHFKTALEYARADKGLQVKPSWNLSEIQYRKGNFDLVKIYASKAYETATSIGDLQGQAFAFRYLGKVEVDSGNLEEGFELYNKSIALLEQINASHISAIILNDMGIVAAKQGDNIMAADFFERSLFIHRKNGNRASIANLLSNLGMLANLNGNYDQAHKYFGQAAAISYEVGYMMGVAITRGHQGMIANSQMNFAQAIEHFDESLQILRDSNSMLDIATHLANQAFSYIKLGDFRSAASNLLEALQISIDLDSAPIKLSILMVVAHLRYEKNDLVRTAELIEFIENHSKASAEYLSIYVKPLKQELHYTPDENKQDSTPTDNSLQNINSVLESVKLELFTS